MSAVETEAKETEAAQPRLYSVKYLAKHLKMKPATVRWWLRHRLHYAHGQKIWLTEDEFKTAYSVIKNNSRCF